jgi:hypothetical protein
VQVAPDGLPCRSDIRLGFERVDPEVHAVAAKEMRVGRQWDLALALGRGMGRWEVREVPSAWGERDEGGKRP